MTITLVNRLVDSGSDGAITAVNTKVYAGNDITWANKKVAISNVLRYWVIDSFTKNGTDYTLTYHARESGSTTGYVSYITSDSVWSKSDIFNNISTPRQHNSPYAFSIPAASQKRYVYVAITPNGSLISSVTTYARFDTQISQWIYVDS